VCECQYCACRCWRNAARTCSVSVAHGLLLAFSLERGNCLHKRDQLSNLGAAGEGETKWLKAKSTSLIVGTGLHPAPHTCMHRTRRSLPSETGAHPAAAATSDSACNCICSCCCNLIESVLICPQLFSLPPAVPFFKSPLNALRRGKEPSLLRRHPNVHPCKQQPTVCEKHRRST